MKIIEDYCNQPRAYADSEGFLKIELEPGDNREEIIKQYHKPKENWWDVSCLYDEKESTDTLLVFRKHQAFLD